MNSKTRSALRSTLIQESAALEAVSLSDTQHGDAERLRYMAADRVVRVLLPLALEAQHDVVLNEHARRLRALPPGARVGTSSLRRLCQVLALRPDLEVQPLRGNVDTRLRKLHAGEYDAVVLATAGLVRLGLVGHGEREREALEIRLVVLHAVGTHHHGIADPEGGVHDLVGVLRHHPRSAGIGVLAEAHHHVDIGAQRLLVEVESFLATAIEEQIRLYRHRFPLRSVVDCLVRTTPEICVGTQRLRRIHHALRQ